MTSFPHESRRKPRRDLKIGENGRHGETALGLFDAKPPSAPGPS